MECCKLIEERSDKNFETHDQVLWDTVHLLGCCLNDLPAQVPKIIDTGFPEKLIESVYKFAPKNIYSQMLRFIQYIQVHERGREFIENNNFAIELIFKLPCDPKFSSYADDSSDKTNEIQALYNDILRGNERLVQRAI